MAELELVVTDGPGAGQRVPLPEEGELTIGRADSNALVLDGHQVSRRHARIECANGAATISDLKSANGVEVNGERVSTRSLASGDVVKVGASMILVRSQGSDSELRVAPRPKKGVDFAKLETALSEDSRKLDRDRRFGPYRVLERVGEGAQGAIYSVVETKTGKRYALKLLRTFREMDALSQKRFQREIEIHRELDHPNIVRFIDAGCEGGSSYLVSEFVEGATLATLAPRGPFPLDSVGKWAREIGAALAHAHSRKILHRDLKPANVMIESGRSRALVLDFGLGVALERSGTRLTATGQSLGTYEYMSPEQLADAKSVDARADVYSFGAVLYTALTGLAPLVVANRFHLREAILRDLPTPALSVRPEVPAAWSQAIERALAKRRSERFASVDEMLAAMGAGV